MLSSQDERKVGFVFSRAVSMLWYCKLWRFMNYCTLFDLQAGASKYTAFATLLSEDKDLQFYHVSIIHPLASLSTVSRA